MKTIPFNKIKLSTQHFILVSTFFFLHLFQSNSIYGQSYSIQVAPPLFPDLTLSWVNISGLPNGHCDGNVSVGYCENDVTFDLIVTDNCNQANQINEARNFPKSNHLLANKHQTYNLNIQARLDPGDLMGMTQDAYVKIEHYKYSQTGFEGIQLIYEKQFLGQMGVMTTLEEIVSFTPLSPSVGDVLKITVTMDADGFFVPDYSSTAYAYIPLIVAGAVKNEISSIGETETPIIPQMILHKPPGDQSYSTFEQSKTYCFEESVSSVETGMMGASVGVKVGIMTDIGVIVSTPLQITTEWTNGFSQTYTQEKTNSYEKCVTTSSSLSNQGADSDVVFALGQRIAYGIYDGVIVENCIPEFKNGYIEAVIPNSQTYVYTTINNIHQDIANLTAELNNPNTTDIEKTRAQNQIDVWNAFIDINEDNKANPGPQLGNIVDYNSAPTSQMPLSYSSNITRVTSISSQRVIESFNGIESIIEVSGTGVNSTLEYTVTNSFSSTETGSSTTTDAHSYVVGDDDAGDRFKFKVYTDPSFGSILFEPIYDGVTKSSCPYEGGYRLDQPELTIDDPKDCSNITLKELYLETENLNDPIELPINMCNDSDVGRNYSIKLVSNTNNADVQLDGDFVVGSIYDKFVDPNNCYTDGANNKPKILITRDMDSMLDNVFLEFIIYPTCFGDNTNNNDGPEEAEVLTIDIKFGGLNPEGDSDCDGILNEDDLCPLGFDPLNPDCNGNQNWTYVDKSAIGGNDGSSWNNAFTYVQDAITAAGIGDTIVVAAGTYYPDEGVGYTDNDQSASFIMKNGVVIIGGFEGVEPFDFDVNSRSIRDNQTILSGDISQTASTTDNSYHIILNVDNGLDNTAILDGFTITKGSAIVSGTSPQGGGGAVFNKNTNPVFRNCHFTANSGELGGAMANHNADPYIINCSFMGNVGAGGGAIAAYLQSYPTVEYCSFSGNSAPAGGQAIRVTSDSYIDISHSELWGNGSGSGLDNIDILYSSGTISCNYCIIDTDGGGVHQGTGGVNADPLFVNQPAVMLTDVGDLRLNAGSAAIDFLMDPAGPLFDQDGKVRPYGAGHDLGAFESGESCAPDQDLTGTQSSNIEYESGGYISSDQTINAPAQVDYNAKTEINLLESFEVKAGAVFHAFIDGCGAESIIAPPITNRR